MNEKKRKMKVTVSYLEYWRNSKRKMDIEIAE
jgi:hypothetical protein